MYLNILSRTSILNNDVSDYLFRKKKLAGKSWKSVYPIMSNQYYE